MIQSKGINKYAEIHNASIENRSYIAKNHKHAHLGYTW